MTPTSATGIATPSPPRRSRMRRKRLLISVGLLLGFVALVLVGLAAMVKHEPSYYRQATIPPGREREALSSRAIGSFGEISTALGRDEWAVSYTHLTLPTILRV